MKKKIIALISGAVILIIAAGSIKPMDGVTPYRLEIQAKVGIGDAKICMSTGENCYTAQ